MEAKGLTVTLIQESLELSRSCKRGQMRDAKFLRVRLRWGGYLEVNVVVGHKLPRNGGVQRVPLFITAHLHAGSACIHGSSDNVLHRSGVGSTTF